MWALRNIDNAYVKRAKIIRFLGLILLLWMRDYPITFEIPNITFIMGNTIRVELWEITGALRSFS